MSGPQIFEATITEANRGGAFVGIAYRGSIVSMGGGKVLGLLKAIREELGKGPGDTVEVTVELDHDERTVAAPDDLRDALDAAGRAERFASAERSSDPVGRVVAEHDARRLQGVQPPQ